MQLVISKKAFSSSNYILSNFFRHRSHAIRLALTPAYFGLLEKFGNPHLRLPPVFHVAGTNGKGSTCAFLRSIMEAAGYKVHVYTSPHLVIFHERIRISGELITEDHLVGLLTECENYPAREDVSDFEAATACAFKAFAETQADFTILETGLGGRLDATNVVPKPLATLITRLSYDHRDYLGDTLTQIAGEKAGIMRAHVPCFVSRQYEDESINSLVSEAQKRHAPLHVGGKDWRTTMHDNGFSFEDSARYFNLPAPALPGAHQYENAALAIAALSVLPDQLTEKQIALGLQKVDWPARLQPIKTGALAQLLEGGAELWLDGGHNDSAGEVLAAQAEQWRCEDGPNPHPLCLVFGMLKTKQPQEFLKPLAPYVNALKTVAIPNQSIGCDAVELAGHARVCGIAESEASASIQDALQKLSADFPQARILICGSLYLAGHVLHLNRLK